MAEDPNKPKVSIKTKLALEPSIWVSHLYEVMPGSRPIYIETPKNLVGKIEATHVLLYPWEWTEEQAMDWVKKDADEFKRCEVEK